MSTKLHMYSELADKQSQNLTDSRENWTGFLDTAARLYKYPFHEQLLIYAQRPNAKACAPIETWNKPMHRYVKTGSKGIALIDDSGDRPRLKYVFDYADTIPANQNSRKPFFWELNNDNENVVIDSLINSFGEYEGDIGEIILDLANALAADYYNDNVRDIQFSVEGSFLEDMDEDNIRVAFREALSISLSYSIMSRCGINTTDYITDEDFQPIFDFNSTSSIYTLGQAVSELSQQVLREIEITIKKYELQKRTERSEFDYGTNLQGERRLSDTQYSTPRNDGINRQVRNDEENLSSRTPENIIQFNDIAGEAISPPFGDRQDSQQQTGTNDERNGETKPTTEQGNQSDGMGGSHEYAESVSRGNNIQGTDIQLNNEDNQETPSSQESTDLDGVFISDKQQDENLQTEKAVEITQDDIDTAINNWNGDTESKNRVYEYMQEHARERETFQFLKDEYGGNLPMFIIEKSGIEPVTLAWQKVQLRIARLMNDGLFLPEQENIKTDLELNQSSSNQIEDNTEEINIKQVNETTIKPSNFRIDDVFLGEGGAKTKYRYNIEAIKKLQKIESENRNATPEEQKILSRYVGWGSIPEAFDENKKLWQNEYTELKSLLSETEYESARASTLNAHYTSPLVIKAIYEAVEQMGFKNGNILEPACGVGNFFGLLPESMENSKLHGIELDSISGRIAKQLYPQADIKISGYEETNMPDNFFDLAIGNVPFGGYKLTDNKYDKYNFLIHDYFFGKTLDQVRPGGIIAFITSKGTLDKENPQVRKYIAQRAELLGAIRLPNNAFLKNAGTEVTSDIIFLQKRDRTIDIEPNWSGRSPSGELLDHATWVNLGLTDNGIPVNNYFAENPEMILGTMAYSEKMYGDKKDTTCNPIDGISLDSQLKTAISKIQGQIYFEEINNIDNTVDSTKDYSVEADSSVRNYSYAIFKPSRLGVETKDDKEVLYYRENAKMYPVDLPLTTIERIKGMVGIRDCTYQLIDYQLNEYGSRDISDKQLELNELYDKFTARYGLINSTANSRAFSNDSAYYLLSSLEVLDEDGNLKRKADMFTKRTIKKKITVTSVDTSSEALALSIGNKACVDIEYMSSLTGFSEEKIAQDLTGVIFLNPMYGFGNRNAMKYIPADEYLSGNVREKLRTAREIAEQYPKEYTINIEALEAAQPKDLEASEITVRLGSTWVDKSYIEQFIIELLQPSYAMKNNLEVNYSPYTSEWNIDGKRYALSSDVLACTTFGTKRKNAYDIIEDTLNLRDVRVYDIEYEQGKEKRVLNQKETTLAQQKQENIKQAFKDWIWKEPERRHKLVKLYNERFNSVRPREYDGSHIEFVGMNPEITLHPHQRNAIAHALYGGNTLFAHEVGAGKTFEMIATAMESKRLGLCQKSIIAVPNHLTEQIAADFMYLYPSANILVATKKQFETKNRKIFCAKIATGNYDAVIMGHSQLEKIPVSIDRQKNLIREQIYSITETIGQLSSESAGHFTVKQCEKTKRSLETRLKKLNDSSRKDDVVSFEQLGVDRLFVDEADSFKNLFLYTKMRNVAGIPQNEAKKSSDLFMKCQYLDELTDGKGVIFATGTPVSNSMTEMYTMQRYLQYSTLEDLCLTNFDAWASTYGETTTAIELAPEGNGYRARTRFSKFYNLPELMNIFKEVADIKTIDMMPEIVRPKANYHTLVVKPSEIQQKMVDELSERAAKVHKKMVTPEKDNMLKITGDGRKIGLDQRLMNPLMPDFEGSKVNTCTNNVFNIWEDTKEKSLTQLIFCDFSTPNKDGRFNVYDDIKSKLINKGIPENEIAFIHDATTETKKKELFAKVRQGKVRVLFGSTFKLGAGTNIQDLLIALHDLDCPWRPRDLEQRAGRIVRQGNQNPEVDIYRYVTEDTFDAYLYQTIENKQKFISQVMTSKSPVRACDDVDEQALSYAEIKALCAGNPLIREKMDLDIDVAKLKLLKSDYQNQHFRLEDNLLQGYPKQIERAKEVITGYENDLNKLASEIYNADEESITPMVIGDKTYTNQEEAGEAIIELCRELKNIEAEPTKIGTYRNFDMLLSKERLNFYVTLKSSMSYKNTLSKNASGNIEKINQEFNKIPEHINNFQNKLENLYQQVENAKIELGKSFPYEQELAEKSERLAILDSELNMDNDSHKNEQKNPEKDKTAIAKQKPSILSNLKENRLSTDKEKVEKTSDICI